MDSKNLIEFFCSKGINKDNKYLKKILELNLEEVSYLDIYKKSRYKKYSDLNRAKEKLGVYIFYTEKG